MADKRPPAERALDELQRLVRRAPEGDARPVMSGQIPDDLQRDGFQSIGLVADEARALQRARKQLAEDLRFEHLRERDLENATWRFVCAAHFEQGDLVPHFIDEHAREPTTRTCFFPVELLVVEKAVEFQGVTLLPSDAVSLPAMMIGPDPRTTMDSVLAVECTGTNYDRMRERAKAMAKHALRVLRATLREDRWIQDRELRFRLGESVWFDDNASGWTSRPEQGWDLHLDDKLLRLAESAPLWQLPPVPRNDVERRVQLALRWFERAQLAVDSMVELLYLFFALESILGDQSEGTKAHGLALRRALLGLATTGGFTHPSRTYLLYDEVRSTAVHGEEPPEVSRDEVNSFSWDVRRAINEFLQFAEDQNVMKRARVRQALDSDERRAKILDRLAEDHPKLWRRYRDEQVSSAR